MANPFEFLRQQAQTEQRDAAMGQLAALTKTYLDALQSAGLSQSLAERLVLDWHRLSLMQVYGLKP